MFTIPDRKEEIEEEVNIKPKLVVNNVRTGFDTGSEGPVNWLLELEEGTNFLAKKRQGYRSDQVTYLLNQFFLIEKNSNISVRLYFIDIKQEIWVDPIDFCNQYSRHEILGIHRNFQWEKS